MTTYADIDEIMSYARAGKVWPSGRRFDAGEWSAHSNINDDAEPWDVEPLDEDWAPTPQPGRIVNGAELAIKMFNADTDDTVSRHELYDRFAIEDSIIRGPIDFIGGACSIPFRFRNCIFENRVDFKDSRIPLIVLRECALKFISLKRAAVSGSVVIEHSMTAEGVNLRAADIGGIVGLKRSRLHETSIEHPALDMRNTKVGSSVFLRYGFFSKGFVQLSDARINGNLDCGKGKFQAIRRDKPANGDPHRPVAIRAKNAQINGSVYLNRKFSAYGEVDFRRSSVGSQLTLHNAALDYGAEGLPEPKTRPYFALNLENASIGQDLVLTELLGLKGDIGLHNANARTFTDNPQGWLDNQDKLNGKLWMFGFRYESITLSRGSSRRRIRWLKRVLPRHYLNRTFVRQPWHHMAATLANGGAHEASDALNIAADQRSLLNAINSRLGSLGAVLSVPPLLIYLMFMRLIRFGYGFGYVRLIGVLAVIWAVNVAVFGYAGQAGLMKPAEEEVLIYMDEKKTDRPPRYYPKFNTLIYSLDVLLPVDLGQQARWMPIHPDEKPLPLTAHDEIGAFITNRIIKKPIDAPYWMRVFTRRWAWGNTAGGWLALVLVSAAFAGSFRQKR